VPELAGVLEQRLLQAGDQFSYTFDLGDKLAAPMRGRRPNRALARCSAGCRTGRLTGLGRHPGCVRAAVRRRRRRDTNPEPLDEPWPGWANAPGNRTSSSGIILVTTPGRGSRDRPARHVTSSFAPSRRITVSRGRPRRSLWGSGHARRPASLRFHRPSRHQASGMLAPCETPAGQHRASHGSAASVDRRQQQAHGHAEKNALDTTARTACIPRAYSSVAAI
jgi:hypothetical protein